MPKAVSLFAFRKELDVCIPISHLALWWFELHFFDVEPSCSTDTTSASFGAAQSTKADAIAAPAGHKTEGIKRKNEIISPAWTDTGKMSQP